MNNLKAYIESGILELYVLGQTSLEETQKIEQLAKKHQIIQNEINTICEALEQAALENAVAPPVTVKPFVFAIIDYAERMQSGEEPAFPPALNKDSSIDDYKEWLDRDDIFLPDDFDAFHAKIIGYTPELLTAIVWLKYGAPPETHTSDFERFLVVEGSCEIAFGEEVHNLNPGDFLEIPLFLSHTVKVTSDIPCKVILQRVAA